MDLFDSLVEVKHGSTTLVEIGDPMWQPVRIDGGQVTQRVALVRATGVLVKARGNEAHTLTFSLASEETSVEDAAKAAAQWTLTLPRTMGDVSVLFDDGTGYKLKNATIERWSADNEEQLGRFTLVIQGGELIDQP
jgi:hypothetical protein